MFIKKLAKEYTFFDTCSHLIAVHVKQNMFDREQRSSHSLNFASRVSRSKTTKDFNFNWLSSLIYTSTKSSFLHVFNSALLVLISLFEQKCLKTRLYVANCRKILTANLAYQRVDRWKINGIKKYVIFEGRKFAIEGKKAFFSKVQHNIRK